MADKRPDAYRPVASTEQAGGPTPLSRKSKTVKLEGVNTGICDISIRPPPYASSAVGYDMVRSSDTRLSCPVSANPPRYSSLVNVSKQDAAHLRLTEDNLKLLEEIKGELLITSFLPILVCHTALERPGCRRRQSTMSTLSLPFLSKIRLDGIYVL